MTKQLTQDEIAQQHIAQCKADLAQARYEMTDAQAEVRSLEKTLERLQALARDMRSAEPKRLVKVKVRKINNSDDDTPWHVRAMEILARQTQKKELLAQLQADGFEDQVNKNSLGVWLKRQADAGVLSRPGHGKYVVSGQEGK